MYVCVCCCCCLSVFLVVVDVGFFCGGGGVLRTGPECVNYSIRNVAVNLCTRAWDCVRCVIDVFSCTGIRTNKTST